MPSLDNPNLRENAVPAAALVKSIRWWDGVAITLSLPAALFVGLGWAVGAIGAWAAIALYALIGALALLHNWLYSEMGAMFADKSGGIALYASEAFTKRLPALGPLATYAYWFAWATAPAIWGLAVATILCEQFWPDAKPFALGALTLDPAQLIALAVAFLSWALAMLKLRSTMLIVTIAGVLLMLPVFLFSAAVFAPGWSVSSFSWRMPDGMSETRVVLAWLFVMAWAAYAVEAAASFIPEFRDTIRDTRKALRVSGLIMLLVFALTPLGLAGLLGEQALADSPNGFLQLAATAMLGGGATLVTLLLIGGILVLSVVGTADAGRALYQSAKDGLTVRQFGVLNQSGVPGRAMTVQLVINLLLVLFVGNPLAVIVAGNVGYVLAHLLAVIAFVLLRLDRPHAPRPIRLPRYWFYVALMLALFDAVILLVGMTSAEITGYGGLSEVLIAILVLAVSQLLYGIRRWQERVAATPALEKS